MGKFNSIYSSGWTAEKAAQLKQVQLPDKTRCKQCHKLKPTAQYSNKQQEILRQTIANPKGGDNAKLPTAEIIRCPACTSTSVNELTCIICEESKGLEHFAKTQRKTPDEARCLICVHDQTSEKWAHLDWKAKHPREASTNSSDSEDDSDDDGNTMYSATVTNPYADSSRAPNDDLSSLASGLKSPFHSSYPADEEIDSSLASTLKSHVHITTDILTNSTNNNGKAAAPASSSAYSSGWQSFAMDDPGSGRHREGGRKNDRVFGRPPKGPDPPMPREIEKLKSSAVGRTVKYEDDDEFTDEEY